MCILFHIFLKKTTKIDNQKENGQPDLQNKMHFFGLSLEELLVKKQKKIGKPQKEEGMVRKCGGKIQPKGGKMGSGHAAKGAGKLENCIDGAKAAKDPADQKDQQRTAADEQ